LVVRSDGLFGRTKPPTNDKKLSFCALRYFIAGEEIGHSNRKTTYKVNRCKP
jgi:hypothetical protein